MLALQIERLRRCQRIDKLIVATSNDPSDAPIIDLCRHEEVEYHRGSLENVLDRYYQAAMVYSPAHVVRLTGDCPLADPELIDSMIDFYLDGEYDFASNALQRTFPVGLDASIFRRSLLEAAWREATSSAEREHVTPYMRRSDARHRIGSYVGTPDRSRLRWTVDTPEDFAFVKAVYERLYPGNPEFRSSDVYALLEGDSGLANLGRGT